MPLRGWYVVSLRPVGEHAGLRRAAARLGARLFALSPLRLEIQPCAQTLRAALAASRVLFTSPAAVRFAAAQVRLRPARGAVWCAVGAGTAAALRRAGVAAVQRPQRMDSEGLLALPALRAVRGASIGLVTAPGGRGLLAQRLRRRGARLIVAEVYRRRGQAIGAARCAALAALSAPLAVLASSGEALAAAWSQLPAPARRRLRGALLVASSARIAGAARALGLQPVAIAGSPRPSALLDAVAGAAADLRFR